MNSTTVKLLRQFAKIEGLEYKRVKAYFEKQDEPTKKLHLISMKELLKQRKKEQKEMKGGETNGNAKSV